MKKTYGVLIAYKKETLKRLLVGKGVSTYAKI